MGEYNSLLLESSTMMGDAPLTQEQTDSDHESLKRQLRALQQEASQLRAEIYAQTYRQKKVRWLLWLMWTPVVAGLVFLFVAPAIYHIPDNRTISLRTASTQPALSYSDLSAKYADLDKRTAVQTAAIANLATTVNVVLTGFALVIALGSGFSVWNILRSETRQDSAFALARKGEEDAQTRASEVHQSFFDSSQKTIGLVNETLALAKEASERAANAVLKKAKVSLQELNDEATELVSRTSKKSERHLVEDVEEKSNLQGLARRIHGFDSTRLYLPEDLDLTPYCRYVLGMDQHLLQQFPEAFANWRKVYLRSDTPPELRCLAYYWIGYENNNIGKFPDATDAFNSALDYAVGSQKYEIRRISLESQFFGAATMQQVDHILGELRRLAVAARSDDLDDKSTDRAASISRTLGNVLYAASTVVSRGKPGRIGLLEESLLAFDAALLGVGAQDYAQFGMALSLLDLADLGQADAKGRVAEAHDLLLAVRPVVKARATQREEHRTKVLCRSTELICCMKVPELHGEAAGILEHTLAALGAVNGKMTVYSQWERKNILKDNFQIVLQEIERGLKPKKSPARRI